MRSGEVYDALTNQWSFIPQMMSARSGVSLVAFHNTLYAIGGFNGFTRLNTCEKFKPGSSKNWEEISNMSTSRSNFATVTLNDYIYAIGGFNGNNFKFEICKTSGVHVILSIPRNSFSYFNHFKPR